MVIEVHEDKALPGFNANRDKTVLRTIKILYAFDLRHTFQRAIEAVVPSMIRTMQKRSLAARLGYDGGGVVAANIVKGAQNAVVAADDDDRLSGYGSANELSRRFHLIGARDQLPGPAEHAQALEFRDSWIDVPGGGNG